TDSTSRHGAEETAAPVARRTVDFRRCPQVSPPRAVHATCQIRAADLSGEISAVRIRGNADLIAFRPHGSRRDGERCPVRMCPYPGRTRIDQKFEALCNTCGRIAN